jgi:hypothetical protein
MPFDRQRETPEGWVKPERQRTMAELQMLIEEKRAELKQLETEALELRNEARLQAVAQARNIMRAHGLTLSDLRA